MKPFTLDTVLSYRERLESMAQEGLTLARKAEDEVRLRLNIEREKSEKLALHIAAIQNEGVSITELISNEEHLTFARTRLKELEAELADKQELVRKAHQQLVERSRERQVMEKLKERQNSLWKQYLNKKEAAMLDEMAIVFHDRK